jgi:hypothetical protein
LNGKALSENRGDGTGSFYSFWEPFEPVEKAKKAPLGVRQQLNPI